MSSGSTESYQRVLGVIVIASYALLTWGGAPLLAQDSSPHWVPFVATLVQEFALNEPSVHATIAGVYVRNSQGVSYTREVASVSSVLPVQGALNVAFLHDRPNHATFVIDFARKTIKRESDPTGNPDFAAEPTSRSDFDRRHAADLFLGKQMVSGVECEGYKLADPRHKGKYRGEEWFAPSLNFLMVQCKGRLPNGGEGTSLVKNLEPGREPDARFFQLPEGFKLVK